MKKTITKIICCALIVSSAFAFTACSSKHDNDGTTTSSTTSTTAVTTQPTSDSETEASQHESTSEKPTKKKPDKTTTTEFSGEMSISVNQALDALNDLYSSQDYEVNATVKEDGYQYFAVYDKNGNKYASVKVNLDNADATETILSTGETNEYNLLA